MYAFYRARGKFQYLAKTVISDEVFMVGEFTIWPVGHDIRDMEIYLIVLTTNLGG